MDRHSIFGTVPDLMANVEYVTWNTLQFPNVIKDISDKECSTGPLFVL